MKRAPKNCLVLAGCQPTALHKSGKPSERGSVPRSASGDQAGIERFEGVRAGVAAADRGPAVRRGCILVALGCLLAALQATAQQTPPETNDLVGALQDWAQDNLDDSVLQALQQVDQDRVRQIFTALQQRFADTDIYELGSLQEAARRALPVLQQFEETRPYASWLQTHLDYLETSEELKRETKPPPPPKAGAPPPPRPPPPLQLERSVWDRELSKRPLPPLAQTYVPRLKRIFTEEKMPPELVWLAEVESSFDPKARSPAGAAGMFQLMPATAKSLNLASWPWDERYQPDKSAHAAARYLRHLHGRFGNWQLALAAYNVGEGRVDALLKQNKARTFEAIMHRLPAETQMYVPKIEATIRKREGRALADLTLPKG